MLNLAPQHDDIGIYRPRDPQAGGHYRCVQDPFEQLEMLWQDRYAPRYGFWRAYVTDVIYRYFECGDLHFGFARFKCQDCGHEYLLAYQIDPLLCPKWLGPMKVISCVLRTVIRGESCWPP